ncbi:MAG: methylaspartate mutase accessory protein GlmL [Defluviitaleaceae bacterium]|nr:methylaspartate mutase accessory protein GlmL [Defluviitaleaceae bacterium]
MKTLAIDFGSTFTKVSAICMEKAEIIGTAKAFTTIETDIRDGLNNAMKELHGQIGRVDFAQKLAASSAGGGLKMVAVGLVPALTAKAASTAACSAGAKVVKTFAYELSTAEQQEIFDINPDLILLSGGTDGGNKEAILHNAKKLAEIDRDFSVIIAGNKSVAQDVLDDLVQGFKHAVICDNVMPEFNTLEIMSAKNAIRDLFMEKIIEAKGLTEAAKLMDAPIIPTPLAVFEGAQVLSESLGDILVVDVGGATTDVYSMCSGVPVMTNVSLKGLPEPFAKRTVEGDLGMRYSLDSLVEIATIERKAVFCGDNGETMAELDKFRALCAADPSFVPEPSSLFGKFDKALCGMAVNLAVERHSGKLETAYSPFGQIFYQTGKDLTDVKYVIGVGGAIIYSPDPAEILTNAVRDEYSPEILKPVKPKFLLDKKYIFAAMGLVSRVDKQLATKIFHNELKEL